MLKLPMLMLGVETVEEVVLAEVGSTVEIDEVEAVEEGVSVEDRTKLERKDAEELVSVDDTTMEVADVDKAATEGGGVVDEAPAFIKYI
jgi:hypothetical protein